MKRFSVSLLCSVACLAFPSGALAQNPATEGEIAQPGSTSGEGDIIVTARKRAESILQVPVIMTAIPQEALERYSTDDIYTVSQRVPGLLIGTSLAANGIQPSMRGIGNNANNATVDSSISLNIDGLQLSQGLAYSIGMFDIGQVEVLKGPQALFYGKNSPAGVISLRSADPTDEFEVIGRAAYEFEAKEKIGEFIISGPVSDSLKLRLAARYSDQEGFFRNNVVALPNSGSINPPERDVVPTKDLILRGTVLFSPIPSYRARLKIAYENAKQTGPWPALQPGFCPEGVGGVAPRNQQFITECKLDRYIGAAWPDPAVFTGLRNNAVPFNNLQQGFLTLEQNADINDDLTLTWLSGLYKMKQNYLFHGGSYTAVTLVSDSDFFSSQLTQELRLTSSFDGPINFVLGGFYQNGDQETRVLLRGNPLPAFNTSFVNQQHRHRIEIESGSVFGQLIWNITPTLEFAPGARWTREVRTHAQYNYGAAQGPLGRSVLRDPRVASSNLSPEATLTYTPTDDLTVFAAYKTGFKSGSFNGIIFLAPTTVGSFRDEKVKGGEVGLKTRLMDRQLNVNLAGYYYKYSDLQVGANEIDGITGAIILRTLNAAAAKVYGVDFDASFAPRSIEGLSLFTAVNYNHARYSSFPNSPCGNGQTQAQGCNQILNPATNRFTSQDLTGTPLVRAPKWMANAGFDYERPVGDSLAIGFGAAANYSSRYSYNLLNLPGFFQAAYLKANANVTIRDIDDKWRLSFIGNNLTNKITAGGCSNSNSQNGAFFGGQVSGAVLPGPAGGDEANCVPERGRELWIRLAMKFGR